MGWESSGVVGFDLGPLLQGQTRIAKVKSAYNSLIIDPRSLQYKTNSSWARNFLMLDLTLGPSFKVKQWFTGFDELSFRWIQICISLRCVGLVVFGTQFLLQTVHPTVRGFPGQQNRLQGPHIPSMIFFCIHHTTSSV